MAPAPKIKACEFGYFKAPGYKAENIGEFRNPISVQLNPKPSTPKPYTFQLVQDSEV